LHGSRKERHQSERRKEIIEMKKQTLFWLFFISFIIFSLVLVHAVLLPFVAGFAVAFFLDPLVNKLEKWGVKRLLATLIVMAFFTLIFVMLLLLALPPLATQFTLFVAKLPSYAQKLQGLANEQNKEWLKSLLGENMPDVSGSVGEMVSKGLGFVGQFLTNVISGGAAVISLFSLLVVTPVVAFYLLLDWQKMVKAIDTWLPPRGRADVRQIALDINHALSGFMRGQALVCLTLGLFYGLGLWLVGLNFGFIIGMITGCLSFIPYVGSLTGLVLALGVAVVQFYPQMTPIIIVATIFGVGQFLEGNILSPKLVGESVGLHPVWLMFALFAFGSLFGFVGLLLAVPLAAMLGVLARYGLKRYLESDFYR
jgi:predicted PurR-regulated permease PerM